MRFQIKAVQLLTRTKYIVEMKIKASGILHCRYKMFL